MTVAPGEGERRAQRGYVGQYGAAGAAIYAALDRDDLIWVGLADRAAGNVQPGRWPSVQVRKTRY
jgi:hypothetical protein